MFRALRRRLPLFLLCVVVVPAAAAGLSALQKKQFTATATLLFRDPQFDQKLFGNSYGQNQMDPNRVAATNLDLVTLQRVAALTATRLAMATSQVSSAVSASSVGQADLVSIQATQPSGQAAARLANAYASQFIAFRRDADRANITSAEAPLKRQIAALPANERFGALGQSLQQRLSQLSVLASLQTGNAELVQPAAVPAGPSSPRPVRNGAFGLFFGIILGVALVVLAESLDRRVRDPDEVEQLFERPLLGALPESAALTSPDPALSKVPEADRDAFRTLWVNLRYFSLSREIRSVLITSSDRNDGKSTVAWGLAVAAASTGTRTLVIEADLRNPSFASRFAVPSQEGLTSVLLGQVERGEAIKRLQLPPSDGDRDARTMDVLVAGRRPPDPTELLQSRPMANLVREFQKEYELIVIDTPPAAMISDAVPLVTMADGVIVVSRLGNSVRDHLRRLRAQLDNLNAPVLGIVLNSMRLEGSYAYAYGYGRTEAPSRSGARRNGAPVAVEEGRGTPGAAGGPQFPAVPSETSALVERRAQSEHVAPDNGTVNQPAGPPQSEHLGPGNGAVDPPTPRRRRLREWLG